MQIKRRLKPSIIKYIYKTMIVIIITLIVLILMKYSNNFKTKFYQYVYDTSFKFNDVLKIYNKYFGSVVNQKRENIQQVSSNRLNYNSIIKYKDGVKLSVGSDYAIPAIESGIVVYQGIKKDYGKVIIVQQINGIDVWYGNIKDSGVKMYDYVTKGSILGNCDEYLYLLFKKDGKILNYEKYI